jgi:hypothetical protein
MLKSNTFLGICTPQNGYFLDTLAHLPTKTDVILPQMGENAPTKKDKISLINKARSKSYTQQIASQLALLEDTKLKKYYDNAWHCCSVLVQEGTTLKGKYCNTRICHLCNRIRTAKMMNGYLAQFKDLSGLQFTTLTAPTISAKHLKGEMERRRKAFTDINRIFRERRKYDMNGIIKQETTYNSVHDLYHPHLHIINDNFLADEIIYEWLKRFPEANRKAQHISEVNQFAFNEMFKYTTKIFEGKKNGKKEIDIFLKPLDNIFTAQYGKRTIQTFGKIKKVSEEVERLQSTTYDIPEYDFVTWVHEGYDWYSQHGALTGYDASQKIKLNFYE